MIEKEIKDCVIEMLTQFMEDNDPETIMEDWEVKGEDAIKIRKEISYAIDLYIGEA